ncbi:MAG: helix-turn-helix transcriptional regulator [Nitrospinae bacterium]|nr:helix-turn-helix transcriptional regulator [Nitrospinota bacterium]MBI3813339.1 helix-turn-helix transcriptional regulator [Nitrospinota bacterium]
MSLGKRIKVLREYFEKTQEEFAKSIGLSQQFLGGIEKGRSRITPATSLLIEKIYGVSPDWLLAGSDMIFEDPKKMLQYLKKKGRMETHSELAMVAEHIKYAWELSHYVTAEWACNLIKAFLYLLENKKIKDLDILSRHLKSISYSEERSVKDMLKDIENKKGRIDRAEIGYIPDRFFDLFLGGKFDLTQDDLKKISGLITPWCFWVMLRGIKSDPFKKYPSTKFPYIDTSMLSTPPPQLPDQDKLSIKIGLVEFQGFITKEGIRGLIELKDKADIGINDGKELYDFISLFEPKGPFEDARYGDWILTPSGIHKQSILILLSKEELKNLKDLAGSIKKRKDILYQITLEYVEKYGAV